MEKQSSISKDPAMRHRCLGGTIHVRMGMHILITIGIAAIVAMATAQWLYFKKSVFVLAIPIVVTLITEFAVYMRRGDLIWPVIGISFFHLFLAGYAFLIFSFFFFFKSLYIIMVLNWAFDTLHTSKTASYYVQCTCIFAAIVAFFLFNLWQLCVSMSFRHYLNESTTSLSCSSTMPLNLSRGSPSPPSRSLNKPPIVHFNGSDLCSPTDSGYAAEFVVAGDRSRRSSLTETRRFAI